MKYRFRILKEARAKTINDKYIKRKVDGLPDQEEDYYRILISCWLSKLDGDTSYSNVMQNYTRTGGKYENYYGSAQIKPFTEAILKSTSISMPDSNEESTMDEILTISTSRFPTLFTLARYDGLIKQSNSAYDKVAFVYKCYIGNKIPQRALNDGEWLDQTFDVSANYKVDTTDFCQSFSAYTLSFNYKNINPNELYIHSGHLVPGVYAESVYQDIKSKYGDSKKAPEWKKNKKSSSVLADLIDTFEIERVTGGDDSIDSSNATSVYRWLYNDDKKRIRKKDYDYPQLPLPSNYKKIDKKNLKKQLANNKDYKKYFGIT